MGEVVRGSEKRVRVGERMHEWSCYRVQYSYAIAVHAHKLQGERERE